VERKEETTANINERILTTVAKENGQEDESMSSAKKYNTHIHSEIENLE
jgi:hypothetical protein